MSIRPYDLKLLSDEDGLLNDNIVDACMAALIARFGKPTDVALSCFVTTQFVDQHECFKRFLLRNLNADSLQGVQRCFLPYNSGLHWTLFVVDISAGVVLYYNSLPGSIEDSGAKRIAQWFQHHYPQVSRRWAAKAASGLEQYDSVNCGVCLLTHAYAVLADNVKKAVHRELNARLARNWFLTLLIGWQKCS